MPGPIQIDQFLKALPSSELFTLEGQMHELNETRGWIRLQEMLERGVENGHKMMDANTMGQIPSKAEYARSHGYLAGIPVAGQIVAQIFDTAQKRRQELEAEAERVRRESSDPDD